MPIYMHVHCTHIYLCTYTAHAYIQNKHIHNISVHNTVSWTKVYVVLNGIFVCFSRQFFCVVVAILELARFTRLASNSDIHLPLPSKNGLKACTTAQLCMRFLCCSEIVDNLKDENRTHRLLLEPKASRREPWESGAGLFLVL